MYKINESGRFIVNQQSYLSYYERLVLFIYRYFIGSDYKLDKDRNTRDQHIIIHKIFFILHKLGIDIGDYGFVWNMFGPYSVGLQYILKELDDKQTDISHYYDQFSDETQNSLFNESALNTVQELKEKLQINSDRTISKQSWLELIGSLAYIGNDELPGESFQRINQELCSRKKQFCTNTENYNQQAWQILQEYKLV